MSAPTVTDPPTRNEAIAIARDAGMPDELVRTWAAGQSWPVREPGPRDLLAPGYARSQMPGGHLAVWGDFDLPAWYDAAPHLFAAEATSIAVYGQVSDTLHSFGEGVQVRWLLDLAGPEVWAHPTNEASVTILVSELCCLSTPLTGAQLATITDLIGPCTTPGWGLLDGWTNEPVPGHPCVGTFWWAGIGS